MRFIIFTAAALAACTVCSHAQQPQQPPFAPYTIGQGEHQWLMNQLGEIPAKWSVPIMGALQKAAQDAAVADAAKKIAPPNSDGQN